MYSHAVYITINLRIHLAPISQHIQHLSHGEVRITIFYFVLILIFDYFLFFLFLKDFWRDTEGNFVATAAIRHDEFWLFIAQDRLCGISVERCIPPAPHLPRPPLPRRPFRKTHSIFSSLWSVIYISFPFFFFVGEMIPLSAGGFVLCFRVAIQYH